MSAKALHVGLCHACHARRRLAWTTTCNPERLLAQHIYSGGCSTKSDLHATSIYNIFSGYTRQPQDEDASSGSADSELACELLHDYLNGASWRLSCVCVYMHVSGINRYREIVYTCICGPPVYLKYIRWTVSIDGVVLLANSHSCTYMFDDPSLRARCGLARSRP